MSSDHEPVDLMGYSNGIVDSLVYMVAHTEERRRGDRVMDQSGWTRCVTRLSFITPIIICLFHVFFQIVCTLMAFKP